LFQKKTGYYWSISFPCQQPLYNVLVSTYLGLNLALSCLGSLCIAIQPRLTGGDTKHLKISVRFALSLSRASPVATPITLYSLCSGTVTQPRVYSGDTKDLYILCSLCIFTQPRLSGGDTKDPRYQLFLAVRRFRWNSFLGI